MTLRELLEEINIKFDLVMNSILDLELSTLGGLIFCVLFFFFCTWTDKKWKKAWVKANENIEKDT